MYQIKIKKNLFYNRGGKRRRYISLENFNGFIKKQNDPDNIPFQADYYEQKSKELIRKYSQNDEHSNEKGLIFNLLILFFDI